MIRLSLCSVLVLSALATASIACTAAEPPPEEQQSTTSEMKRSCLDDVAKAGSAQERLTAARACAERGFDVTDGESSSGAWSDAFGDDFGSSDSSSGAPSPKRCRTALTCTDGRCTCTAGPNAGRSCNGSSASGASSCSSLCTSCE